jgi:NTE family protein
MKPINVLTEKGKRPGGIKAAAPRVGIALGGGGARGLCHIEFLKVLDELSIRPCAIAGTSIGAIIGGMYAAGVEASEMAEILSHLGLKDLKRLADFTIFNNRALVKGKGIEHFLAERVPVSRFEDCRIPLKVVATDFWKREQVVFESGELIPAIRASMSLPAIFEPVRIGDRVLVDGGAVNPLPFDLIRCECDLLIAIDVAGEILPDSKHIVPRMMESVLSTFMIMQNSIVENKMHSARPDIYIKPRLTNIGLLDFHREDEILEKSAEEVKDLREMLKERLKDPPAAGPCGRKQQ